MEIKINYNYKYVRNRTRQRVINGNATNCIR